ncbi:hypothetical protein D3C81_2312100 [compost metagenome]
MLQRFGAGREQRLEQLQVDQHLEGIGSVTGEEQLQGFLEQARRRNLAQQLRHWLDR